MDAGWEDGSSGDVPRGSGRDAADALGVRLRAVVLRLRSSGAAGAAQVLAEHGHTLGSLERRAPAVLAPAGVEEPGPSEETPTKSATLDDIRALEAGCAGEGALDLRHRAIVSILKTTAARDSGVRLQRLEDVDFERSLIRFRRGKGGKTLDVTLQPETRAPSLPTHRRLPRPWRRDYQRPRGR